MTRKQKAVIITNFIVYLLILVWVVLFHGTLETLNSAFDPDLRAVNFYLYVNGFESILNMLVFIPFGLYMGVLCEEMKLIQQIGLVVAGSLFFETTQYIFAVGATDIMDVINNSIGGAMGLIACCIARRILKERFNQASLVSSVLCTLVMLAVILFVPLR